MAINKLDESIIILSDEAHLVEHPDLQEAIKEQIRKAREQTDFDTEEIVRNMLGQGASLIDFVMVEQQPPLDNDKEAPTPEEIANTLKAEITMLQESQPELSVEEATITVIDRYINSTH